MQRTHTCSRSDMCVVQAVKRMLQNCSSRDTTLYVVPGGFHEVLMGSERVDCTHRIADWMLSHLDKWTPSEATSGATESLPSAEAVQPSSSSEESEPESGNDADSVQPQRSGISGAELKQLGSMEAGAAKPQRLPGGPLSVAACQVSAAGSA